MTVWLLACGGGSGGGEAGEPPAARLRFAASLAPGAEAILCVDHRLPRDAPLLVGAVRLSLPESAHHAVVYATDAEEESAEPFGCVPFGDAAAGRASPLLIAQAPETSIELPAGVAFALQPDQVMRIEVHAVNAGTEETTVEAEAVLEAARGETTWLADALFYGHADIDIEAGAGATVGPAWLPAPDGARVLALAGHTHRWGTGVRVWRAAEGGDQGDPIYAPEPWDWQEPPTAVFDPPLRFEGGDGFRFACDFENGGDTPVHGGLSARDEMCAFWAWYYPALGFRACTAGAGLDSCCPGPQCGEGASSDRPPPASRAPIGFGEACPEGTGCADGLDCWFLASVNALVCTTECRDSADCAAPGADACCADNQGAQASRAVCAPAWTGLCSDDGEP